MPNEPTATPGDGGEPGGGEPQGGQVNTEPYLGTYATREDAEKGLAELQKEKDRLAGEVGYLKQSKGTQDKLTEVLGQLAASQKPSEPKGPDWDSINAQLKKAMEDDDPAYILATLQNIVDGTAAKDDLSRFDQKLENAIGELRQQIQDINPEYLAHRETVAELQKEFPDLSRPHLVKMAAMLEAKTPAGPPADTPPSSMPSNRISEPPAERAITPEAKAALKSTLAEILGSDVSDNEISKVLNGGN